MIKRALVSFVVSLFLVGTAAAQQASRVADTFMRDMMGASDAAQMQAVIERHVDVGYLMAGALGSQANDMSPEQLRRFAEGLRGFLASSALAVSTQASGAQFTAAGEAPGQGAVVVRGNVTLPRGTAQLPSGGYPVQILVRREQGSGQERVGDLSIDGNWVSSFLRETVNSLVTVTGGDSEAIVSAMEES